MNMSKAKSAREPVIEDKSTCDPVEGKPVRDPVTGHFLPGNNLGPGRPPGALNKLTRSLREKVLDGFNDPKCKDDEGVTRFIRKLKNDYPPAAAGVLAKMIPSGDVDDGLAGNGVQTVVIIRPIDNGKFLSRDDIARNLAQEQIEGPSRVSSLVCWRPVLPTPPIFIRGSIMLFVLPGR
jgi:hypothetical protein